MNVSSRSFAPRGGPAWLTLFERHRAVIVRPHKEVQELINAKKKGETVESAEQPAESTNVVDLMDALRASVDQAKSKEPA